MFQNWHKEFDEFWLENSKVSKLYTLMGWFWPNYMFELKKYRGVMLDCTQDWYKVWRKTGLCFHKLTWGIWQISTRALESLQNGVLMAYFYLKLKMLELNNFRGVMKRNWLVSSKLTWEIWRILTRALENLKNLHFNGLLLNKVHVWAKKRYRGILLDGTEYWCNIWRKSDLYFQKWHEEFSKFSPEHVRKSKNWE